MDQAAELRNDAALQRKRRIASTKAVAEASEEFYAGRAKLDETSKKLSTRSVGEVPRALWEVGRMLKRVGRLDILDGLRERESKRTPHHPAEIRRQEVRKELFAILYDAVNGASISDVEASFGHSIRGNYEDEEIFGELRAIQAGVTSLATKPAAKISKLETLLLDIDNRVKQFYASETKKRPKFERDIDLLVEYAKLRVAENLNDYQARKLLAKNKWHLKDSAIHKQIGKVLEDLEMDRQSFS